MAVIMERQSGAKRSPSTTCCSRPAIRRAARRRRRPHPAHPRDLPQPADHLLGDGYGHRGAAWRSPWRRPAASASSTATSSRSEQAAQVRQVKKFESGMVVNPVTIRPDATLADALDADAATQHLRHPGGRGRRRGARQARRHPHQPRRALRHRPARSRSSELMTRDNLVTVSEGVEPGRGQAPAAPAPHREAAGRRRRLPLRRPDHGQGHREGGRQPATPARTSTAGCASPRRPASATPASRAPSG